ncbi:MAG: putative DNA binding domain-containing protein [Prevotella sp.]|nr:putative DNA binding domain-containing protein [Prevotella sp.]
MRYTIEEIRQMPEGQTFDCKSIHIEPKALANTIVAMANADGGMIAVGISDKTRRIEGVDQDKAHLNEILRTPFDFCVPTISVTTEFMPCQDSEGNDNQILIIHVPASPRLHANQADEVFWRVGDKSRKLPFEERLQLMYDKGERYYEDSPAFDATIEDIDMDAVKAYMKRIGYGKSPMEYLQENKGFLTYKGDVPQVSTACILLFGKRPQNFFPRARVRFIKYYGTEEKVGREMNVIKDVTFEGRILDQIQKTIDYLETQVKEHSYLGEDGLFKTDREYPKFVIQEMTVNSVCHRDYSIKGTEIQIKMFDDRLVFETPGKLPGIVRTDNIRHTHFSRNPKIAEYLKAYDYVKEFGEGVDRMCRELSAIGTKEPQYHLVAFIMKASVWANKFEEGQERARKGQENIPGDQIEGKTTQKLPRNYPETTQKQNIDITPIQKGIVDFLLHHPYAGRKEISSHLGSLSEDGVKYNLKVLQQKGVIKRIGPAKGGYWKVLSDETSE